MATNYIALPDNHTVIYTPFLQFLTLTMQVYVRLSASEHNNIVTQAIKETVYQNSPSNDTKVKTESAERSTKHPETANRPSPPPNTTGVKPNLIENPLPTDEFISYRMPRKLGTPYSQRTPRRLGTS